MPSEIDRSQQPGRGNWRKRVATRTFESLYEWGRFVKDPWVYWRFIVVGLGTLAAILVQVYWSGHATYNGLCNYGALVFLGLLIGQWRTVILFYFGCGAVWIASLVLAQRSQRRDVRCLRESMLLLIRRGVILEVAVPWAALAFVLVDAFAFRLFLFSLAVFILPALVDGPEGRKLLDVRGLLGPASRGKWAPAETPRVHRLAWEMHFLRSWTIVLPLVGLAVAWLLAPSQSGRLIPVFVTIVVVVAIRFAVILFAKARQRARAWPFADDDELHVPNPQVVLRARIYVGCTLLLATILLLVSFAVADHGLVSAGARDDQKLWERIDRARGASLPAVPPAASVFIISDSQFHELRGRRTAAQSSVIDAIVPVAVRPVQLDLLSGAMIAQFARIYHQLLLSRQSMTWVHLGDFGDMGCRDELERYRPYLELFGLDRLAALVPGNHDSTFIGNFFWHPAWEKACVDKTNKWTMPIRKTESDQILRSLGGRASDQGAGRASSVRHQEDLHPRDIRGGYYAQIAEIGRFEDKPIIGAFVDTCDYAGFWLGAAGAEGHVSCSQADWFIDQLEGTTSQKAQWREGKVVLFLHHPFEEMSVEGRNNVGRIIARLGDRTLGLVSAHTHKVGHREHDIRGMHIHELVVGSTTDPPAQAALLDVYPSPSPDQPWSLRLRTIPALYREPPDTDDLERELSSIPGLTVRARYCRAFVEKRRILDSEACKALLEKSYPPLVCCPPDSPGRVEACQTKEIMPGQDLEGLPSVTLLKASFKGQQTEEELYSELAMHPDAGACVQDLEAQRMLSCLGTAQAWAEPSFARADLFSEIDAALVAAFASPDGRAPQLTLSREDLVCLAWAGSVLQGHKTAKWRYDSALQYAWDRAAAPESRDILVAAPAPDSKAKGSVYADLACWASHLVE